MVQVTEVSPRVELERMARSSVSPHRKVVQATALSELADGVSVRSTARLLRTYPNTVAACDRFKLSNDPNFEATLVGVVGLYLDPCGTV
jgi:hypothetical protein